MLGNVTVIILIINGARKKGTYPVNVSINCHYVNIRGKEKIITVGEPMASIR